MLKWMTLKRSYEVDYTSFALHQEKVVQNEILSITLPVNNKRSRQQRAAPFIAKSCWRHQKLGYKFIVTTRKGKKKKKWKKKKERLHTSISGVKKEFSFPSSATSALFIYLLLSWHHSSFSKGAIDATKAEQLILMENSHPVSTLRVFLNYQISPIQRDRISHTFRCLFVAMDSQSSSRAYH